ncbi:MAG TPA: hypothetical protein VHD87_14980 [Acidimicrobiales bacterium]|nr:hypothetical protein [Acidimicrobiales bacterium]
MWERVWQVLIEAGVMAIAIVVVTFVLLEAHAWYVGHVSKRYYREHGAAAWHRRFDPNYECVLVEDELGSR